MASKKQKISDGGQIFQDRWTKEYFFCASLYPADMLYMQ